MATHTTTLWVNDAEARLISSLLAHKNNGQEALREYSYYAATRIDNSTEAGIFELDVSKEINEALSVKITLSDENAIPKAIHRLKNDMGAKLFMSDGKYKFHDNHADYLLDIQMLDRTGIETRLPVTIKMNDKDNLMEIRFDSLREFNMALPEITKDMDDNPKMDFLLGDKIYNNITIDDFCTEIKNELAYYKKVENFIEQKAYTQNKEQPPAERKETYRGR